MLAGVGPFAIEQGLVPAADGTTTVRVFNVNTSSRIDAVVQTPHGRVTYDGGHPHRRGGRYRCADPAQLPRRLGAITGAVFPTGHRIDVIDGVEVTCIDAAMPLMIVRAADLGVDGHETPEQLDAHPTLRRALESLRRAAGSAMGLGDVSGSVVPKPVLVSEGDDRRQRDLALLHPAPVPRLPRGHRRDRGATAFALPGTVASERGLAARDAPDRGAAPAGPHRGRGRGRGARRRHRGPRASLVRTARKIFQGDLHLPDYVFSGAAPAAGATSTPARCGRRFTARHMIVPTPAGGANDAIARAIARNLGPLLGRPVVVDNRAGAHGSIASEYVARAAPDGNTLLLGYVATHGMHPAMQTLGYDPVADFEPVGLVGYSPTVLVAGPTVQARTVDELVTYLREHPESYTYASAGEGTAPHFAAELFKLVADVDIAGLTFGGSSAALSDVVAGRTQLMFSSLFTAYPWIASGRLRALALAGSQRVAVLPGVPTLHEAGIDGVDVTQWYGVFAPAKTPADVVDSLNGALNEILTRPDSAALFNARGIDVQPGRPDQFGRLVDRELTKWKRFVDQAGPVLKR